MGDESELFDPQFLSRLRALFFKLRKRRQLSKKGAQATPAAGHTREFKDHRLYTPGDDYRSIDWRLFARHEQMFIRIFEEVQEYHIHILIDRSGSMADPFGAKRVLGLRLAVALTYLGLIGQHRVSLLTLADGARREMPPLKGQGHIHTVLRHLAGLDFGGVTDLVGSLRQVRPGRDRRGLVFLISDLFGRSPQQATEALHLAVTWPAETHVVQILDPGELHPDLEGELQLIDVETAESRRIWFTQRDVERYTQAVRSFVDDVHRACLRRQIDHVTWTTDGAFEDMFVDLLSRGSSLAGA
ncbi:MAG: DUF58 domain-containing protein [Planctomycetota bacterium]